ncbi:MAG: hypothetical protein GY796_27970 [Chloroflexi bacterium]|nr:hypothetical protein [Chloroflexota bacterium]
MKNSSLQSLLLVIGGVILLGLFVTGVMGQAGAQPLNEGAEVTASENEISSVQAVVTSTFSYQGQLKENGNLVNGNRNFVFRLYSDTSCTTQVGSNISMNNVAVNDGLFNVNILVDYNDFNGQQLWLETQVQGTVISCQEILASPYALSLRPGAIISGSIPFSADPYGGAAGKFINNNGRGLYVETQPSSGGYGIRVEQGGPANAISVNAPNGPGVNVSADGTAIYGNSTTGSGVMGFTSSTSGYGVYGQGPTYAGYFENGALVVDNGNFQMFDSSGNGMFEIDPTFSTSGVDIFGDRSAPLRDITLRSNDDVYIYLEQDAGSVGNGWFYVRNNAGGTACSISNSGNLTCNGTKSSVMQFSDNETRALYAIESPIVVFEDFGKAQLMHGVAIVDIEPLFAESVNLEEDYQVFLTPVDGWGALYVTNKTATSFEVRDENGSSNLSFDYRIVAKRVGYEDVRLEAVPKPDQAPENNDLTSNSDTPETEAPSTNQGTGQSYEEGNK